MAGDPQDLLRKLQRGLNNAKQQGRRFGAGGNPRGPVGAVGGVLLLVGGYFIVNNSLFNGALRTHDYVQDESILLSCADV